MNRTLAAAHTGCGESPDNTMASFVEGVRSGADIVEVDIVVARDGTAILMHDDTPQLLLHTYEEWNQPHLRVLLNTAYEEHEIATLEQIFQAAEPIGINLNLDIKSAASIEPTIALIRKYGAQERSYITGYSESITEKYPDIQVMLNTPVELTPEQLDNYESYAETTCQQAKQRGYTGLNMKGTTCRPYIVEAAHHRGLKVWVYTVNEQELMQHFIEMNVDAITTREPETLLSLLGKTAL
ncbi:glycerophosphodiester phosphodiesterase [Paenibacillus paridis]|uniref:glycerophosphodiester phosphodiesterase n=1 Tax=Paenibacillus paridis TaxID=2583376 RepID=UPI001121109D|nr:glycerophosphodiester phosphodiesterase [Paenibacillus paridis]